MFDQDELDMIRSLILGMEDLRNFDFAHFLYVQTACDVARRFSPEQYRSLRRKVLALTERCAP